MIFIKKKDFVKISDVCGDLNIVITLLLFKSSGTDSDLYMYDHCCSDLHHT